VKKELVYSGPIVIGRRVGDGDESAVDLDLAPERAVSRQHVRLWVEEGTCWVQDLTSASGTIVDGKKLTPGQPRQLLPRATIKVGRSTLELVAVELPLMLRVEVACSRSFNYALAYADVPFVETVTLTNLGPTSLSDLDVRVVLPGYARSEPVTCPALPAGASQALTGLRFNYQTRPLAEVLDRVKVELEVWVNGVTVPMAATIQVEVLPARAWYTLRHPRVLAAFVLPECLAVQRIVRRCRAALRCLVRDVRDFGDLFAQGTDRTESIVKALYFGLQERYQIDYGWEPVTYAPHWQAVRLPANVVEELEGTCIDLALLFAACLENRHLHPVLVLIRTRPYVQHALVGCWRGPSQFKEAIEKDGQRVLEWIKEGKLLLLDSVGFAHGEFADQLYADCQKSGHHLLEKACHGQDGHVYLHAVDVSRARMARCEPLPLGDGVQLDRDVSLVQALARQEAEMLGSQEVGARHLLLGLLAMQGGLLPRLFAGLGENMAETVAEMARKSLTGTTEVPQRWPLPLTEHSDAVLRRARKLARQDERDLLTEGDLVEALLRTRSRVRRILKRQGLTVEGCLEALRRLTEGGRVVSRWHSSGFLS
jgi:hypothetical protein